MTPQALLDECIRRIIAQEPSSAASVEKWKSSNRARLLVWSEHLLGLLAKGSQPPATELIDRVTRRAQRDYPDEAAWLRRYRDVMVLFADIAMQQSALDSEQTVSPTRASERIAANIQAARIAMQPGQATRAQRIALLQYSGFGGLSLKSFKDQVPADLFPTPKSLIDEYYTPLAVTREVARTIARVKGPIQGIGLEPAAGVGRFLTAAEENRSFSGLSWIAVEYSRLSAAILRKAFPATTVHNEPFEAFIAREHGAIAGQIALAFCNPPFGVRGANKTLDPDKSYREDIAYVYFARRVLDLIKAGGVGVLIAPQGLITGDRQADTRSVLLRRHHLLFSFRLPSSIYPGAEIVTDCSFWQSRGGELDEVGAEDDFIVEGNYYQEFPEHILGRETNSARGRYTVEGDFSRFPDAQPRELCVSCSAPKSFLKAARGVSEVDADAQPYVDLAGRLSRYQNLLSGSTAERQQAIDLHSDLTQAIVAQLAAPDALGIPALKRLARTQPTIGNFIGLLDADGRLRAEFAEKPAMVDDYQGVDTVLGVAEHIYSKSRRLTKTQLLERFGQARIESVERELLRSGWCIDRSEDGQPVFYTSEDYYSGDLWKRLDGLAGASDSQSKSQADKLKKLIGAVTLDDASPTLRDPWVPASIITDFLREHTDSDVPTLAWESGILQPRGYIYSDADKWPIAPDVKTAIGFANHDLNLFDVEYEKIISPETGLLESAQEALDKARIEYGKAINRSFLQYLVNNEQAQKTVLDVYNRTFRGYIARSYPADPLPIARWGSSVTLRAHQLSAAWRVILNNGGLLAHDVGLGKTLTGIASVGYLRQLGRARRPLIVVPNSIVWKWHKEVQRALPDFRILVVGSSRYTGRGGRLKSRIDDRAERNRKWTQYQLGLYDVAIVTYSVFAGFSFGDELVREYANETPALLREIGFRTARTSDDLKNIPKLLTSVTKAQSDLTERRYRAERSLPEYAEVAERAVRESEKRLGKLIARRDRLLTLRDKLQAITNESERKRAEFDESLAEWVAERVEGYDAGETNFESLGVDLLVIDEAHNYKNLWSVGRREGGVPKYLGAIQEGSERAKTLSLAAFAVQRSVGGSGVLLLSATPAKNSPLEFFTLLSYVDHQAWSKLGILDAEYFIDRYLKVELKAVLKPDGSVAQQSAVTGFTNLVELRGVVNRYGDFKTAAEVGLKLPRVASSTQLIPMDEDQTNIYRRLRSEYEEALTGPDAQKNRNLALGILARMGNVALHPELETSPEAGWTWSSAGKVKVTPSSKMIRAGEIIQASENCNAIIFVESIAMHRWLFDYLVSIGIDAGKIAILNAERTPTAQQRQEIAENFNGVPPIVDPVTGAVEQAGIAPSYRIVIANSIANEGIDLQVFTCIVIHLDFPFEPATLQQRNGRAVRQFNQNAVVGVYYLASEKSYDGIKLAMIKGKLRWQDDLINGTERETNNPAAALDLTVEDLLLMLADDPVAARAALDQIRANAEAENRKRVEMQAWRYLGEIANIAFYASKQGTEADREAYRQRAIKQRSFLDQVSPDTWPWFGLIEIAMSGIQCALVTVPGPGGQGESMRLVWSGLMLEANADQRIVIGIDYKGSPVYRPFGDFRWRETQNTAVFWASLAPLPLSSYKTAIDDTDLWVPKFLESLATATRLEDLGLKHAPDDWKRQTWGLYAERILRAMPSYVRLPLRSAETLRLESADKVASADALIPPTPEGWQEFRTRVSEGVFTDAELEPVAEDWFFLKLPYRLADDREIVKLKKGSFRLVTRIYQRILVLTGQTGIYIAWSSEQDYIDTPPFWSQESAKTAARWLAARWPDAKIPLDENTLRALRFASGQSAVSADDMMAIYEGAHGQT